jgi:Zn-finger nucleic acid-binding protein
MDDGEKKERKRKNDNVYHRHHPHTRIKKRVVFFSLIRRAATIHDSWIASI